MTTTQTASSAPASAGAKPAAAKPAAPARATTANANAKPAVAAPAATAMPAPTRPLTSSQLIQKLDAAKAAQVTVSSQLAQANALLKSYTDVAMVHGVAAAAIATVVAQVRAAPDQATAIGQQTAQPNICAQVAAVIKLEAALAAAKANVAAFDQALGESVDADNAAAAAKKS